ncbi:MAG: SurA N-terminal domain-containing protein [Kiritimatiellia bacterium]
MVIHQFNKLIRNKWAWGIFAVIISAAFCFDDLFSSRAGREESVAGAGTLGGEPVDAKRFSALVDELRGFGQQRDWKTPASEINRRAWENYAALKVAETDGLAATDADVQAMIRRDPSFQKNGAFSFTLYRDLLRQNGLTPERFEALLRRRATLMRIGQTVLASAAWASPMEIDRAVADMTDTFTVKVASFVQEKKDADAVKLDDAGLRKWYDENAKSLELPDRVKIRYLKFSASDPLLLARMSVTEDEMRDHFDMTVDKYTTTDTNGVEKVRKFEELTKAEREGIEQELRRIAAVQCLETNLNDRAYGAKSLSSASRLDEIAREEKAKVETSDWFSVDGGYSEGFMKRASAILPGAKGFEEAVAELDESSEDLRYGVVSSDHAVWLIEKAETSPRHTPTFEEAKEAIRPRALRAAKAEAFRKQVEAVAAKGAAAVAAVKGVSTNIVFNVSDLSASSSSFEHQMAVARAATSLQKGEVSKFTPIGVGKAILVVCEDRVAGDAAKAMVLRSQVRNDLSMLQLRQLPESWKQWNLDRLGFQPNDLSSVETVEVEE